MAAAVYKVVEVVARAVDDLQRRQAPESTSASSLSSTLTSVTSVTSISSFSPSASSTGPDWTVPPVPTASPTQGSGNSGGGNPGTSSPLLFFVALGFGVVFTNLWIIVGVKYCFRYNSRNRQLRLTEDGEPIGMEHMHQRPRRRREKKLMTMDEVNEKFPMMKYKNWVAQRAKAGLPTAGGVSAPPSRAGSIRSVHGATVSKERASAEAGTSVVTVGEPADKKPQTETAVREVNATGSGAQSTDQAGEGPSGAQARPATAEAAATGAAGGPPGAAGATTANDGKQARQSSDDEEEDEHINAALPPELLGSSGDTCAICIDTLENDDDIRGLTCGHAFHASCLDPWLTSRRASCPLCKADYYTPKPRPPAADDGAAADPNNPGSPHNVDPSRMNMPNRPIATWYGIRGHRIIFSGRLGGGQAIVYSSPAPPVDYPDRSRGRRSRRHQAGAADAAAGNEADGSGGRRFHIPFFGSRGSQPSANSADQAPAAAGPRAQPSAAARASSPANAGGILSRFRLPRPSITVMRSHRMPPAPVAPLGWEPMASGANVTPSQLEAGVRNP